MSRPHKAGPTAVAGEPPREDDLRVQFTTPFFQVRPTPPVRPTAEGREMLPQLNNSTGRGVPSKPE